MIALLSCTSGINQAIVSQAGDGRHGTARGNSILQSAPGTPRLAHRPCLLPFCPTSCAGAPQQAWGKMLGGLVDYAASSDEEEQQAEEQQPAAAARRGPDPRAPPSQAAAQPDALAAAQPAAPRLPSAAELLGGAAPAGDSPMQPPPLAGKRGTPDSGRTLLNPFAPAPKAPRSGKGAAGSAAPARARAPPGVLLPPQLRGRANVATEDLSSLFTKESHRRQQQAKQAKELGCKD